MLVPGHRVAGRVDHQPSAPDRVGQRFAGRLLLIGFAPDNVAPAQDRLDPGNKQALAERLGDIVVRAHRQTQRLVQFVILAGKEDQRKVAFFAQTAEQFETVHARHLDVAHRKIWRIVEHRLEGAVAIIIQARGEAFGLERDRDCGQDVAVIVDKRNRPRGIGRSCPFGRRYGWGARHR